MPSLRWRMMLLIELDKIGLCYTIAELEAHDITEIGPDVKYDILHRTFEHYNTGVVKERKALLLDRVKVAIVEAINSDEMPATNLSTYLSNKMHYNYAYLSSLFSIVHGSTLHNFIIEMKVERTKQLIMANQSSISEIAWRLNYSSVSHLSNQFKKVTGHSPSHFKNLDAARCASIVLPDLRMIGIKVRQPAIVVQRKRP
ncbi:MAG: AraC family transcriptional regulator [Flavobacteriales bacterium]